MPDQDFNITIKTIADTTGIKLTEQGLNSIKKAALDGNKEAVAAMQSLTAAQKQAAGGIGIGAGFAGGLGIGIATSLIRVAINEWKSLIDENNKFIESAIKTSEKMREVGESILAMQDAAISARRTSTEPLGQSYIRLQQELIKLQTEQKLLDLPTQAKEWEELQKQINATGNEIQKVQSELKKQGVTDVTPVIAGPKAGKGESQALVNEMERNRKAAEEQLKQDIWEYDPETGGYKLSGRKQFPTFQPTPPPPQSGAAPNAKQYPSPIGPPMESFIEMIKRAFDQSMLKYWGP